MLSIQGDLSTNARVKTCTYGLDKKGLLRRDTRTRSPQAALCQCENRLGCHQRPNVEPRLPNGTSPWPTLCCKQQHSINSREMSPLKITQGRAGRPNTVECHSSQAIVGSTYSNMLLRVSSNIITGESNIFWETKPRPWHKVVLSSWSQCVASFVRHLQKSSWHICFMCLSSFCLSNCLYSCCFFLFLFKTCSFLFSLLLSCTNSTTLATCLFHSVVLFVFVCLLFLINTTQSCNHGLWQERRSLIVMDYGSKTKIAVDRIKHKYR